MNKIQANILIVDDRPENLTAMEAVLHSPRYRIVTANSGEEALKCVLSEDFAVILLDVQMPGMNGFDTAKLIKARKKSCHIPIIFVTAISQASEHVMQGYAAGAIDYIFKPYNPDTLRLKVEGLVKVNEYQAQIKLQNEILKQQKEELLHANKSLQEAEERLEEQVRERTKELLSANEQLLDEIEERKKLTHQLNMTWHRFYKIFHASPSLMSIRSLKDGRYIDVNESWQKFTGYSLNEAKGYLTNVLQLTETNQEEDSYNNPDLLDGLHNVHVTYTSKSGEHRDGLLSTDAVKINGEDCIISVLTDITEKISLEKEMTRLDRLHLIGEMAAGIAHEIRNPMTSVRGFLQLAQGRTLSQADINLMIEELDRANSIITEYLSLAKDKMTNRKMQSLNSIIRALYPLIQADAVHMDKHVELKLEQCPSLLLDQKEIRQLLLNLALNGLESMAPKGTLTIKTFTDKDKVVLMVQDEGCGIDKAILGKLGTPFLTTKANGTGLGLAVCYSVAARHDASINIDTGLEGTKFSVHFKVPSPAAKDSSALIVDASQGECLSTKVLIC